jgi:integrase
MMDSRKNQQPCGFDSRPEHKKAIDNTGFLPLERLNLASSDRKATGLMSEQVYPFKAPRLIIPAPESEDQRWIISYWAWDADKGCLVQQSDYKMEIVDGPRLSDFKDVRQKKKHALYMVSQYQKMLEGGYYLHKTKRKALEKEKALKTEKHLRPATESLYAVIEAKKDEIRPRTYGGYKSKVKKLSEYLELKGMSTYSVSDITGEYVEDYMRWLLKNGQSRRSRNNHLLEVKILFNYLKVRPNPCDEIRPLKTPTAKNVAYNKEQKKILTEYMNKNEPYALFASAFMYHTMARTKDLSFLQVKHIGLYREDLIYVPGTDSKNWDERHVHIHPEIKERLRQIKNEYPPDWYVFGKGFRPSENKVREADLGGFYNEKVLKKLNIPNPPYTFYSWKHTGACDYLDSPGATIAGLMQQGGWRSMKSITNYIRSIGRADRMNNTVNVQPYLIEI